MKDKKLRFTQTQSGWFCEYFGEIWGIKGMGGFGITPEAAEANLWQLLKKQHDLVYSTSPSISKFSSTDIPIDPQYEQQFKAIKD